MRNYLTNQKTADEVVLLGERKGNYTLQQMFLLGLMGGVYIALSSLGYLIANATIGGGMGKFIGAAVFPTGLMLVLLVGGSLFTGDCLTILALIKRKVSTTTYIRNLIVVWIGNLFGSMMIAYLSYWGGSYASADLVDYTVGVATYKVNLTFLEAVSSGFLCNILVAVGVWFMLASKDLTGKILAIWFPIMLFILGGFQHIVANMYYLSIGKILDPSIYGFGSMGMHFLAVTLGNFLSGALFLPLVYYVLYIQKRNA